MLILKSCGIVFKITPAGALATVYEFEGMSDGSAPSGLIQAKDGSFYGIASPPNNTNDGSIFQLTSAGVLTTVVVFNGSNGAFPNTLLQTSDGNLYGTSYGETGILQNGVATQLSIGGTLFQLSPTTRTLETLYNFCSVGCAQPSFISADSLLLGSDGNLYGLDGTSAVNTALFRYYLISPTAPAIAATGGVLNGASFQPGISPGSWMTIEGTNLSSKTDSWINAIVNGVLPTTLDDVKVMVGDQPAYVGYISPTQIKAVVPSMPAGNVPVTVINSNGTSQAVMAEVQALQPAFFQWGIYAVATHLDYSLAVKNGTFGGTTVPAKPGEVIVLWGTGFGATSPGAQEGIETPSRFPRRSPMGIIRSSRLSRAPNHPPQF